MKNKVLVVMISMVILVTGVVYAEGVTSQEIHFNPDGTTTLYNADTGEEIVEETETDLENEKVIETDGEKEYKEASEEGTEKVESETEESEFESEEIPNEPVFLDKGDETPDTKVSYYASTALNIRKEPNGSSEKVGTYEAGEEIVVLSTEGGYWKTSRGYASSKYIVEEKEAKEGLKITRNKTNIMDNASFDDKVSKYREEYRVADEKYKSDTIFVTINKYSSGDEEVAISHVVVKDPSQIKESLAMKVLGKGLETTSNLAKEEKGVLVTNGSYFSKDDEEPVYAGFIVSNGEIVKEGTSNGKEICLKSDGTLYTPESGIAVEEEIVKNGLISNWGTDDPVLIQNGELEDVSSDAHNIEFPRMAIGMVEPCEYYVITAGSSSYKGGVTFSELQNIFNRLECVYARSLCGGRYSTLVFKGNVVNTLATEEEQKVSDFLVFTE